MAHPAVFSSVATEFITSPTWRSPRDEITILTASFPSMNACRPLGLQVGSLSLGRRAAALGRRAAVSVGASFLLL